MVLAMHGVAGGWDELIIAGVALLVLWVAVKLAGRKTVGDADEEAAAGEAQPDAGLTETTGIAPAKLESTELGPTSAPPAKG
jgi:hypothetical protein